MKTNLIITAAIATLSTASIAFAAQHVVTQSGFAFSPSSIAVAVGDTVQFVRTSGSHTVTSGTACAANGLFSSRLSASTPNFIWTVPASVVGSNVGYFCVPHCGSGMVGSITVVPSTPSPDFNSDGFVNASDLSTLLGSWGSPGITDLDQDGSTGASDLATLLAAWTG